MTDSVVQKYFRSQPSSLYQWENGGRELCWLGGTTIAFHEEIAVAIERLAKGCLPGFPSIVVALAATRKNWSEVAGRISRVVRALENSELPSFADAMKKHRFLTDTWAESARKLGLLSSYVEKQEMSPSDRAELLATMFDRFESAFNLQEQKVIATAFRIGLPNDWLFERKGDGEILALPTTDDEETEWRQRPPIAHRVLHDVLELLRQARMLSSGLRDFGEDELDRHTESGFAHELVEPESPLDAPQSYSELLDSLNDDAELSGFARLARHLMAAITLPRSLDSTQEIPAGGVSDISNRGQLDRLLLSELALDDLTLAVRVASNEAMYIRRESPPNPQVQARSVLIDNSLPMWGIPKLYATAMAMALQAGADSKLTVDCYRPDVASVVKVPLNSSADVSLQLASLAPVEHAGRSLLAFQEAIDESGDAAEPVVITTGDILESDTFRLSLDQLSISSIWIIAVERDGRLTVHQRTRQGMSVRKQIHLPLDQILSRRDDSLRRRDIAQDLPDILQLDIFPLRLSHNIRRGRAFLWAESVVSVSDDGRLMHWSAKAFGAQQLCDDLPKRSSGGLQLIARSLTMIQFYVPGDVSEIVTLTLIGLQVDRVRVDDGLNSISDVRAIGSTVLVFGRKLNGESGVVAVDAQTGQRLNAFRNLNKHVQRNGRCLRNGKHQWAVLSFTGTQLVSQLLPREFQAAEDVVEMSEGNFVMIDENGKLRAPASPGLLESKSRPKQATRLLPYLPGSDRLGVVFSDTAEFVAIDSGARLPFQHDWRGTEDYELQAARKRIRLRTAHWRFRRIGIDQKGRRLWLQSSKGVFFAVVFVNDFIRLGPIAVPNQANEVVFADFEDCPEPSGAGFRLKVASWEFGSRAWLDSRGLLHLKSTDPKVPQVTLALQDGSLSGWLSSSEIFGDDYYFGSAHDHVGFSRVTPLVAWGKAIEPFLGFVPWSFHYRFDTAQNGPTTRPVS